MNPADITECPRGITEDERETALRFITLFFRARESEALVPSFVSSVIRDRSIPCSGWCDAVARWAYGTGLKFTSGSKDSPHGVWSALRRWVDGGGVRVTTFQLRKAYGIVYGAKGFGLRWTDVPSVCVSGVSLQDVLVKVGALRPTSPRRRVRLGDEPYGMYCAERGGRYRFVVQEASRAEGVRMSSVYDVEKALLARRLGCAYVVQPAEDSGAGPRLKSSVGVDAERVDGYRGDVYSGTEGALSVSRGSRAVSRGRFLAVSAKDAADYVCTLLAPYLAHLNGGTTKFHYEESGYVTDESFITWREATESEANDPSIRWEMEGSSKYGRRMINRERGIYRGLTVSEFYGSGIVD